jgi:hypothetical protein
LLAVAGIGQQPAQLAPPLLSYHSIFFNNTAVVQIKFAQQGTQIHYTMDGRQPSENDPVYHKPLQIKKSFTTIKAIASGKGYLSSDVESATFIKDGLKIQSVQQTPANARFPGSGINRLIDNRGGIADLHSNAWMGFQDDSVEITGTLQKPQLISSVLLNFLQDHGSWIFLPQSIRVFYFNEQLHDFEKMNEQVFPVTTIANGAVCLPMVVTAPEKIRAGKFKIILTGIKSLPEGHPGKGQHGWVFIDEIKVY